MPSEHTLELWWGGYDGLTYNLVCEDIRTCDDIYIEGDWPDATTCRCTEERCACRTGDHEQCSDYGSYIPDIGDECLAVPVDGCGYQDWFNNVGEEMIKAVPAQRITTFHAGWEWSPDGPILDPQAVWLPTGGPARGTAQRDQHHNPESG